jgi:hypothetical protein
MVEFAFVQKNAKVLKKTRLEGQVPGRPQNSLQSR